MNKGLIFFLGAISGAIVGVLATKKHYESIAEDQMHEYAEHYLKKEDEVNQLIHRISSGEKIEDIQKENSPKPEKNKTQSKLNYDNYDNLAYDPYKTNYAAVNKKNKVETESSKPGIRDPFIISADEYDNAIPDYDKVNLIYFAGSSTFAELDSAEEYDEAYDTLDVKKNILNNPEFNSTGDFIYIRNEDLELDYSIIYDDRDYSAFIADAEMIESELNDIEVSS